MDLSGKKFLIVDDDQKLGKIVSLLLENAGADVIHATDGVTGLKLFYKQQPDLVILDVLMPGMNGWDVCKQIRSLADTPIIMLTTLREDQDIVRGLENGADDYLVKPFSTEILMARIKAILRRVQILPEKPASATHYDDGYLKVDLEKRRVFLKGEPMKMSATELKLLSYLMLHIDHVLSYQQILNYVWGAEYRENSDYVHVYISHLRRKIELDPSNPQYLITEHGIGYRFQKSLSPN